MSGAEVSRVVAVTPTVGVGQRGVGPPARTGKASLEEEPATPELETIGKMSLLKRRWFTG